MAFEDIRNKAVQVVSALTPDTKRGGKDKFREWKGPPHMIENVSGMGADRTFEVHGTPGAFTNVLVSESEFEWEGRLEVLISYCSEVSSVRDTRSRVDEDWDLLSFKLSMSSNYFDDGSTQTQLIEPGTDGPEVDETDLSGSGMLFAVFPFRVNYRTKRS